MACDREIRVLFCPAFRPYYQPYFMKLNASLLVLPALVVGMQAALAADITGTVTLNGTAPAEKVNDAIASDPNCGKLHPEPVTTHFYVVGDKNGLGDVVITLKGEGLKSA